MSNPLLNITDLIDFPAIKPEHVVDGMKALIADAESTLKPLRLKKPLRHGMMSLPHWKTKHWLFPELGEL